ncbi:hypothetical protein JM658_12195 [Joostella atrarenae]|uniref:DUF4625 domain-containing protein n=1 Tax=Joostella atrarenae TaxID=679257 RepID=A0ABS9J596_9FLAO|nr:hypothetical protein [Joostella atrarenae]MCF8715587.1 hypothetical protein [Joostella atrarenae]
MKKSIIYILIVFIGLINVGCDKEVGFLDVENAEYLPNTMTIRLELDPRLDALRIENESPWVSQKISGVLGTEPLSFSIAEVRSEELDEAAVEYFSEQVSVQGLGQIVYPLSTDTAPGNYIVSVGIHNTGDYYEVVKDAITITVE